MRSNPLPFETFPISRAVDAFRHMAQAKHIGKVVVSLEVDEVSVVPSAERPPDQPGRHVPRHRWRRRPRPLHGRVAGRAGARHLLLTGRSGAATEEALQAVARWRPTEYAWWSRKADVSDERQMDGVIEEIHRSMPPLRGVVHAAGILDDGVLLQLDEERFARVMAPKVGGAWNLHRLTLEDDLDFFVLFSSAASVLGSPGQGNYVAANAFLDALAHHRRALGMPALAINWGAWTEVGLATRSDRVEHLTRQGIMPFTPEQGLRLMERMLERDLAQCMGIAMDWGNCSAPTRLRCSPALGRGTGRGGPVKKGKLRTEGYPGRRARGASASGGGVPRRADSPGAQVFSE